MIVLCSSILVLSLIGVAFTLDKQEEKGKTFEQLEKKVKKEAPDLSAKMIMEVREENKEDEASDTPK